MGFFDKFFSKGGKNAAATSTVTLEPPIDNVVEPLPQPESPPTQSLNNSAVFSNYSTAFESALAGNAIGNRNILVVAPNSNGDVSNIVTNLQAGEACVIDLENMPVEFAQRRLDFLSGVISALNGQIRPLNTHQYILTPDGMGVMSKRG